MCTQCGRQVFHAHGLHISHSPPKHCSTPQVHIITQTRSPVASGSWTDNRRGAPCSPIGKHHDQLSEALRCSHRQRRALRLSHERAGPHCPMQRSPRRLSADCRDWTAGLDGRAEMARSHRKGDHAAVELDGATPPRHGKLSAQLTPTPRSGHGRGSFSPRLTEPTQHHADQRKHTADSR